MSEFKGTKGKWKVKGRPYTFNGEILGSFDVVTAHGRSKVVEVQVYPFWGQTLEASEYNAQLIASAPEMLEALKMAKSTIAQLRRSMQAHPEHEAGSEFDDYTTTAQESEDAIELLIQKATTI